MTPELYKICLARHDGTSFKPEASGSLWIQGQLGLHSEL